jgi:hypothetical protein
MPLLTESECKDQHKSTLDRIASVALLQYTLVATVCFVFINELPSYQFLGFNISRTAWGGVSHAAFLVLNLYMIGNLHYLSKLVRMYPKQRRILRFLSCHHSWFLNPFGLCGVRVRWPIASSILYLGALMFGLFPAVHLLDTDSYYQSLSGYKLWSIYIPVVVLSILHLISLFVLMQRITEHGNLLWSGYYFPRAKQK